MKFNHLYKSLFLGLILFSTTLLAQQNLGTKNKYPIGTDKEPVTAVEYCNFLNDKAQHDIDGWVSSSLYYDTSFMEASENDKGSPRVAIVRFSVYPSYRNIGTFPTSYKFSVASDHTDDRIVAVYSSKVQREFNEWRASKVVAIVEPTRQELCDYINAKIAGRLDPSYLDRALEIQNRYPQASVAREKSFNKNGFNSWTVVSFQGPPPTFSLYRQVDNIIDGIYGSDRKTDLVQADQENRLFTTTSHIDASDNSINNYIARWGLVLSEEPENDFLVNIPKHVMIVDGNNPDERLHWGQMDPSYLPGVPAMTVIQYQVWQDRTVMTKVYINSSTFRSNDTPATETKN